MIPALDPIEQRLNDQSPEVRREILETLLAAVERGDRALPEQGRAFNMHCHTFYSFNGYGLSPTALAWLGRREGLYAIGIVDFDVLDAVDEFLAAAARVGLKASAGIETRIYVPEFGDRVINSPGEPGISYHMGVGFTRSQPADTVMLDRLKSTAQVRNRGLVERVNTFLAPVTLDYEKDVLPLTPSGNATERHVCTAYDLKAREHFADRDALRRYWEQKLGLSQEKAEAFLDDTPNLHGTIRAKTMKAGGVGYVKPEGPQFPRLEEVNQFVLANGGIPTFAWLDGTSEGEQALDELLDLMVASGVRMVNIIPDRNWNFKDEAERDRKVALMYEFVEAARQRSLPVMAGTEMNAHGQRFVDDFDSPALRPLHDEFLKAVHVLHAHTVLQRQGIGYTSDWADEHFPGLAQRAEWYADLGAAVGPRAQLPPTERGITPSLVLGAIQQ